MKGSQNFIEKWCDKEIGKERMTAEEKSSMVSRINYGDTIQHLSGADFIVEAASEDFDLKKLIFENIA